MGPPIIIVLLGLSFGIVPLLRGQLLFGGDTAVEYYPFADFLGHALRTGVIPQWAHETGLGHPVTADGEAQFSPIRLALAWAFNPPAAFMLELALIFAVTGLGTYLFLREAGVRSFAATAGAIAFMFGSQCVVYVRSMGLLRAACLLPCAMWLAERSFHRKKLASVFWAAPIVIGMQFISGNPTFAAVTLVAVVCYLALRWAFLLASAGAARKNLATQAVATFSLWALIVVLGIGMAGIQVIPMFKHQSESVRAGGLSFEYAAGTTHTKVKDLLQPLFPYVYSLDSAVTAAVGFYDGALIAVMALFCLLGIRRAGAPAWCLSICGLLATLISLGASTPVYGLLFRLPGFNSLRFPFRYQFFASFCFACLGAIGLDLAANKASKMRPARSFAVIVIVVLAAAAAWRLRPDRHPELIACCVLLAASVVALFAIQAVRGKWRAALIASSIAFLLADVGYLRFHANYARTVAITDALHLDGLAGWLRQDQDRFRILSIVSPADESSGEFRLQNMLTGSSPPLWGLETAGYHGSLELRRHEWMLEGLPSALVSPGAAAAMPPFFDFLRVKYVIAKRGLQLPGWNQVRDEGGLTLWQNPSFQNREFLVGETQPEGSISDKAVLDQVRSRSIDFRRVAVVAADKTLALSDSTETAEVERLPRQYDALRFRVRSDKPAFLVVPSNYYPGWTATVNGVPARIYRTNWIGMGLPVNAGESLVEMRFTLPGFRAGVGLSILSLACWIIAACILQRRLARPAGVQDV